MTPRESAWFLIAGIATSFGVEPRPNWVQLNYHKSVNIESSTPYVLIGFWNGEDLIAERTVRVIEWGTINQRLMWNLCVLTGAAEKALTTVLGPEVVW